MKIIISGCGKVGHTLAKQLVKENHDIIIIDNDPRIAEEVGNELDVFCVTGDAASHEVLTEAGVQDADLIISMTESDEKNLLICLIGKKLGVKHTIARVRNPVYAESVSLIKHDLGLSMFINPELSAAREISRILRCPAATKIEPFAKGRVEMFSCTIKPDSVLDGIVLKDISSAVKCRVFICGVQRNNEVYIPDGMFELKAGDVISFIASYKDSNIFFKRIGENTSKIKNVVIMGGGRLTYYLSRIILEAGGVNVKIIEVNKERCIELDEHFQKATIINGDATDTTLFKEEDIENADAVVSLTGIDEQNVLISQYISEKHPDIKVITKIKHSDFENMFRHMKVGSLINPKNLTADNIIRYVRAMQNSSYSSDIVTLHHVIDGKAEALEFIVNGSHEFLGKPIETLKLRKDVLLASISRKGRVFTPSGKDTIEAGDTVIAVTMLTGISSINDLFE